MPDTPAPCALWSAVPDTSIQHGDGGPCAKMLCPAPQSGAQCAACLCPTGENSTPSPLTETLKSSPAHSLLGSACALEQEYALLHSLIKNKGSLCFWTKFGLILLAQRTPGRSTLVGDPLKRVDNSSFWYYCNGYLMFIFLSTSTVLVCGLVLNFLLYHIKYLINPLNV